MPDINLKLRPQILDMKPGTRVVSNTFTMDDLDPRRDLHHGRQHGVRFLLHGPLLDCAGKSGRDMETPAGGTDTEADVSEVFRNAQIRSSSKAVLDGRINGDTITFSIGDAKYTGQVTGNTMQGTFIPGQSGRPLERHPDAVAQTW